MNSRLNGKSFNIQFACNGLLYVVTYFKIGTCTHIS